MRFLLITLLLLTPALTQIKATTVDGNIVILNHDGSWIYENQIKKSSTDFGNWKIKYFVDDFGDPTNEGYITNKGFIKGTFSNSVTTNSELKAYFIITNDSISLKLFEYGSSLVKTTGTRGTDYLIALKHNGVRFDQDIVGTMYGDRITMITNNDAFGDMLKEGGEFNMLITERGTYASSSYKLKFNSDGLNNILNTLYP